MTPYLAYAIVAYFFGKLLASRKGVLAVACSVYLQGGGLALAVCSVFNLIPCFLGLTLGCMIYFVAVACINQDLRTLREAQAARNFVYSELKAAKRSPAS